MQFSLPVDLLDLLGNFERTDIESKDAMLVNMQWSLTLRGIERAILDLKRHARPDVPPRIMLHYIAAHAEKLGKHSFLFNPCAAKVDALSCTLVNARFSDCRILSGSA